MRAIAIDLPGIGESTGAASDGSKRAFHRDAHDNERSITEGTTIDVPTLLMLSGRMAPLVDV